MSSRARSRDEVSNQSSELRLAAGDGERGARSRGPTDHSRPRGRPRLGLRLVRGVRGDQRKPRHAVMRWDQCNWGVAACRHNVTGLDLMANAADCEALQRRIHAIELLGCARHVNASVLRRLAAGFGTCAVVGSSGQLLSRHAGREIDSHDAVVRFNNAPTAGYAAHVGSRTTVRLCNGLNFDCIDDVELLRIGAQQYPTTQEYSKYLRATRSLPNHMCTTRRFSKLAIEVAVSATRTFTRPSAYSNPTQGLFGALFAMALCRDVRLYGVDRAATHAERKRNEPAKRGSAVPGRRTNRVMPFHYYDRRVAQGYYARSAVHHRHVHDLSGESTLVCEALPPCLRKLGKKWECVGEQSR